MKRLCLALLIGCSFQAQAADLTDKDGAYLDRWFGLHFDGGIVKAMTPAERADLHALIEDKLTSAYPDARDGRVQAYLFGVYGRECRDWAKAHITPDCPPIEDPTLQPGKEIADRQCNMCHLFGTTDAPPFFAMRHTEAVTQDRLTQALAAGHRMSPIKLTVGEIKALIAYINGSK